MYHKPELLAWRERVLVYSLNAAQKQGWADNWNGLVEAEYEFILPKPKRPTFKWWPGTKPDLDKLIRAVNDAISPLSPRKILAEDSRIVRYTWAEKRYVGNQSVDPTGLHLTLRKLLDEQEH